MKDIKVGDKVRVIANTNHHFFTIGDIVTITIVDDSQCFAEKKGQNSRWWVNKEDIELVEEPEQKPIDQSTRPLTIDLSKNAMLFTQEERIERLEKKVEKLMKKRENEIGIKASERIVFPPLNHPASKYSVKKAIEQEKENVREMIEQYSDFQEFVSTQSNLNEFVIEKLKELEGLVNNLSKKDDPVSQTKLEKDREDSEIIQHVIGHEAKDATKKPKRWRADRDIGFYYLVDQDNQVERYMDEWDDIDTVLWNHRNYFQTKESAQQHADNLKTIAEIRNRIEELNDGWEPEFKNGEMNYAFHKYQGRIRMEYSSITQHLETWKYFDTAEIGEQLIKEFGDRLEVLF